MLQVEEVSEELRRMNTRLLVMMRRNGGDEDLLIAVVVTAIREAAAYGSNFATFGAERFIDKSSMLFRRKADLIRWMYEPESACLSLAWICSMLTDDNHSWEKVYISILEYMEDLLAWRKLTPEERVQMRRRMSARYKMPLNNCLRREGLDAKGFTMVE